MVNGGSIKVGPKGTLDLEIGNNTTVVSASGPVTFDAASHITVTPVAVLPTNTNIRLVHSDTSLSFGNEAATLSTIQVPFLFASNLSTDANNLTLTLQRKTVGAAWAHRKCRRDFRTGDHRVVARRAIGRRPQFDREQPGVGSALNPLLPISRPPIRRWPNN